MRLWFITHIPSGTQRQRYAESSAQAIGSTGWPPDECTAEETR